MVEVRLLLTASCMGTVCNALQVRMRNHAHRVDSLLVVEPTSVDDAEQHSVAKQFIVQLARHPEPASAPINWPMFSSSVRFRWAIGISTVGSPEVAKMRIMASHRLVRKSFSALAKDMVNVEGYGLH